MGAAAVGAVEAVGDAPREAFGAAAPAATRTAVVGRPLDAAALLAEVAGAGHGASALFVGTVRETNDGRPVTGIDYSAYLAMAEGELARIAAEGSGRFGTAEGAVRVVAEHRLGTLGVGEASVAVAAAHARRAPAMDAVRYVVEELKRRVPIWKREHYADGSRAWVDPTAPRAAPDASPNVAPNAGGRA